MFAAHGGNPALLLLFLRSMAIKSSVPVTPSVTAKIVSQLLTVTARFSAMS